MRTRFAAAALPVVFLVTACADPSSAGTTETPASSTATASAEAHASESVTPRGTCNGYYVGRSYSLDRKIRQWTPAVGEPATPESTAEISAIRDRLAAQIHDAEVGPAAILDGVHAPFSAWLDGDAVDPADIVEATGAVRRMCDEMGVDF